MLGTVWIIKFISTHTLSDHKTDYLEKIKRTETQNLKI